MMSVCLLIVLLVFSEQGETMQCAVWKDEHEQTKTAISISGLKKKKIVFMKIENRNRGFKMKKTENWTYFKFPNRSSWNSSTIIC